ncbi:unnamed protein product [Acanthoscelides obtectus]|uniref:HTH psq-type domain-containing protein n=1 Tax=Acanthoscelides obtectus TaxID=200917 RepID=A0A9P0L3Z5_ACAOB|nr:unnamed protein product [Acanthoscelides obtectus]CAK1651632.1 hypothetical protein AOBTE_LOCUS17366 [Acanthoscelides obtectus]
MPKRIYNAWSQANMNEALEKYQSRNMGFNEIYPTYNIPKPTFRRHLKNLNKHKTIGRPKDLTAAMGEELVQHILELELCLFGLTIKDLRRLAYNLPRNIIFIIDLISKNNWRVGNGITHINL